MKFLRVLIFAFFPVIRNNMFPQIKITANIFPAKISSRENILYLKFATQKYNTKKSCLFNHNLSKTMKYWFIVSKCVFLLHVLNKNENIINAGCWVLSENRKINSQQEKPICRNRKNQFPQNTKKLPIHQNKLLQKFRATR